MVAEVGGTVHHTSELARARAAGREQHLALAGPSRDGSCEDRPMLRSRWSLSLPLLVLACSPASSDDTQGSQDASGPPVPGPTTTATDSDASTTLPGATTSASGPTTTEPTTTADSTATDDGFVFDLGPTPDAPPPPACLECSISLFTTASTALQPMGDGLLVEVLLDGQLVYALDEWGPGRLAFSGDSNILYAEGECPIWSWLGGTGDELPRVLCFGAKHACTGLTDGMPAAEVNVLHTYPGTLDYAGTTLPAPYADDAAAIAADYDVLVYAATNDYFNPWSSDPADALTVAEFVQLEGGGAYVVGEYSPGGMGAPQHAALQEVAQAFDMSFDTVWLDWGEAGAAVELECFPAPAG